METDSTTPTTPIAVDKAITVEVPEDRVPEFYAWYAHFLAASRGPRRRRHGGPGRHGSRRCHSQREHAHDEAAPEAPAAPTPAAA